MGKYPPETPVNLLNAQILLIRRLLGVPARPMTNYMDGIEKTPNRAILKGRLFSGGPFVFPHSSPAWSQTEIFVSSLYPGKGGGFFIPSTSVLGLPGPEKTQIFSFDKNYLSRPVMLWAPSEMAAGGPFYFSPFLLPCVHGWRRTNHRKERPLAWWPAPAAGLHLPADSSHYVLAPAAGRPAPSAALPRYQPKRKTPPEIITMDITGGALPAD